MALEKIIKPDNVLCNAHAGSKKHCLEILSELLAQNNPDIANEEIFKNLIERERLGCTSLTEGVAFPHCRVNGASKSVGAVMKLSEAVDFDSSDGVPVDLVFGLMVPEEIEECHHADIEVISTLLLDQTLQARLRATTTSRELFDALVVAQQGKPARIPLPQES